MIENSKNEASGNVVLAAVYLIVGASKLFPALNMLSIFMVFGGILYCAWQNQFFKLAPLFIFFNSSILYYAGTAIVDVYFAAYIVIHILKKPLVSVGAHHLILAGFSLYCICVVSAFRFSTAISIVISFFALAILIEELRNRIIWVQFCKWYIVALLSATLYGIGNYSEGISNSLYSTFRYTVTFTDPNYAGFFLSVGLYMALFLKRELRSWIRYSVICVSIISILMTISSSALIANAGIIVILYFSGMGNRKVSVSAIGKVIICIIAGALLLNWAGDVFPGVERTFSRFAEKIVQLNDGGIASATTDRSILWKEHLNYFWSQDSLIQILFGGNYLTDRGMDYSKFSVVSHQVYVDALICFGLVGTALYIVYIIYQLIGKWKVRMTSDENILSFTLTLLWILYSFILSMFPFWGFMVFLMKDVRNEVNTDAYKKLV